MAKSIDIIVPSFRVQKEFILPITELAKPQDTIVKFYIIVDNPAIFIDDEILEVIDNNHIHLIVNQKNLGASLTRNVGIDAGCGEWILFLDDDIKTDANLLNIYNEATDTYENEIGFIGLVTVPPANSAFTEAILASGSASIFTISQDMDSYAWGATANIMIKREALGSIRFLEMYPKKGGGEDIDFFLRVRKANNYKNFKTLKKAQVWHPWWDNGKPNFKRPFRYGKGTGFLIKINPEYTRYDFPSTPEMLFFSFLFFLASLFFAPSWSELIGVFILGVIFIELVSSFINAIAKAKNLSAKVLFYIIVMKFCYDAGVLSINLSNWFFKGFLKRFNYSGIQKKDHFIRLNRYKISKLILFILLMIVLFEIY
ncbi:glycosyltransferase family 2 protein [Olivibacter domesticus]|uniref:glycosyltransferase family 2 protein n=1 Tax=Olivibacter domesticus TaxID=407022 RepID=UPI003616C6D0